MARRSDRRPLEAAQSSIDANRNELRLAGTRGALVRCGSTSFELLSLSLVRI